MACRKSEWEFVEEMIDKSYSGVGLSYRCLGRILPHIAKNGNWVLVSKMVEKHKDEIMEKEKHRYTDLDRKFTLVDILKIACEEGEWKFVEEMIDKSYNDVGSPYECLGKTFPHIAKKGNWVLISKMVDKHKDLIMTKKNSRKTYRGKSFNLIDAKHTHCTFDGWESVLYHAAQTKAWGWIESMVDNYNLNIASTYLDSSYIIEIAIENYQWDWIDSMIEKCSLLATIVDKFGAIFNRALWRDSKWLLRNFLPRHEELKLDEPIIKNIRAVIRSSWEVFDWMFERYGIKMFDFDSFKCFLENAISKDRRLSGFCIEKRTIKFSKAFPGWEKGLGWVEFVENLLFEVKEYFARHNPTFEEKFAKNSELFELLLNCELDDGEGWRKNLNWPKIFNEVIKLDERKFKKWNWIEKMLNNERLNGAGVEWKEKIDWDDVFDKAIEEGEWKWLKRILLNHKNKISEEDFKEYNYNMELHFSNDSKVVWAFKKILKKEF